MSQHGLPAGWYIIKCDANELVLDLWNGDGAHGVAEGTVVQGFTPHGGDNQKVSIQILISSYPDIHILISIFRCSGASNTRAQPTK